MSLLTLSETFKPFRYPFAYAAWQMQQKVHWLVEEIPLNDDVVDWNKNLNEAEKNLLTQIFRLFTQMDVDVGNAYIDLYMPVFKNNEIRLMLLAFANMEGIHQVSYAHLLDTVGMPETEYSAFLEYSEMSDKHNFLKTFSNKSKRDVALTLAAFAAFTEGLQLFASFAILLNFPRFNRMKGMGQVITFSVRDETLHVESCIKLFHTFLGENPDIDDFKLKDEITAICQQVVENEDRFIDLAFKLGPVQGLTADEVKRYIRYIADIRLYQLHLDPIYYIPTNPLPWIDQQLNAVEFSNFFEARSTEYSKAATTGTWDDVF